MSWFSKLFGGRKQRGPGGRRAKCANCGKSLFKGSGLMSMGGDEMMNYLAQRPYRCANCGIDVCSECGYDAAKKLGLGSLTCPQCGGRVE